MGFDWGSFTFMHVGRDAEMGSQFFVGGERHASVSLEVIVLMFS